MKKSEQTRHSILEAAFRLIYVKGYQATSIDDIIRELHVTKGAFFYHFKSKDEMGLAMIREFMRDSMKTEMFQPMETTENPLDLIHKMMSELLLDHPFMTTKYGCPTYNLVQEMAPLNEDFNRELAVVLENAREFMMLAVDRAKELGFAAKTTDSKMVADFVMAGYGGIRILGKLETDHEIYKKWLVQLEHYLGSLKFFCHGFRGLYGFK